MHSGEVRGSVGVSAFQTAVWSNVASALRTLEHWGLNRPAGCDLLQSTSAADPAVLGQEPAALPSHRSFKKVLFFILIPQTCLWFTISKPNRTVIPVFCLQVAAAPVEGGEASSWSGSTQTKTSGSAVQSSVCLWRPGHRWAQLQRWWCHWDTHWRYRSLNWSFIAEHVFTYKEFAAVSMHRRMKRHKY